MNSRHLCLGSASVFALDRSWAEWDRIYTFSFHSPSRKAEKLPRSARGIGKRCCRRAPEAAARVDWSAGLGRGKKKKKKKMGEG